MTRPSMPSIPTRPLFRLLKGLIVAAPLALAAPALAQHAFDESGIDLSKSGEGTRVELNVMAPNAAGERRATMTVSMNDADGCFRLFDAGRESVPNAFRRLCETMDKTGRGRIEMRGTLREAQSVGRTLSELLEGTLTQVPDGVDITIRMSIDGNGRANGLAAWTGDGPVTAWTFTGGLNGDADTGVPEESPGGGTAYTLRRNGADSVVTIRPVENNTALRTTMTLELQDQGASITESAGWSRLSEAADKDGDRRLSGRLERRADLGFGLFAGKLVAEDTGASYDVTFRDLPGGKAAIGVRTFEDTPFAADQAPWEIVYGTETLQPRREFDLLAHDWRVPQEEIDGHGASMEVAFKRGWLGYEGRIAMWFGEDATGYCPDTAAYRQLCERIQKDGPLALAFSLDDRREPAAFGWSGTARVAEGQDFNVGPWSLDVFQGSSIGDWGDEEPDALYLRIRALQGQPGAEAVAWLKLVPLDRPARTIGPDGQIEGEVSAGPATPPAPSTRLGPDPNNMPSFPGSDDLDPTLTAQSCEHMEIAYREALKMDGSQFQRTATMQGRTAEVSPELWIETLEALWSETQPIVARLRAAGSRELQRYCIVVGRQINSWRAGNADEFPFPFPPEPNSSQSAEDGGSDGRSGGGSSTESGRTEVAFDPNDPPNGATYCEALQSVYSQIGSADEQNRARALLEADPRMGSWRLPTTEQACATAASIFSERGVTGF